MIYAIYRVIILINYIKKVIMTKIVIRAILINIFYNLY